MNFLTLTVTATAIVVSYMFSGVGAGIGLLGPLIPIATITGHGGLYGSSIASAALLKLKAAAYLAALAKLTESGFHLKIGHGWHPHDKEYNYKPSGSGWHRRRRSVQEPEPDLADPSYEQVLSHDQLGCGMRFVCELAASPYDELADDGKLILELFGRDGKTPEKSKAKLTYSYASLLGASSKDASACSRVYAKCPYGSQEILESLRAANL